MVVTRALIWLETGSYHGSCILTDSMSMLRKIEPEWIRRQWTEFSTRKWKKWRLHEDGIHQSDVTEKVQTADVNDIRCGVCSFECGIFRKLRRHYKKTHPECSVLCCQFCDFVSIDKRDSAKHKKKKHKQDRFSCGSCEFSTKSWRKWKHHENTAHQMTVTEEMMKDELQDIKCDVCTFKCRLYRKLSKHYKKVHPEIDLFCCQFCDFLSTIQKVIAKHKKVEHRQDKLSSNICEVSTNSWNQKENKLHQTEDNVSNQTQHDTSTVVNFNDSALAQDAPHGFSTLNHCKANKIDHNEKYKHILNKDDVFLGSSIVQASRPTVATTEPMHVSGQADAQSGTITELLSCPRNKSQSSLILEQFQKPDLHDSVKKRFTCKLCPKSFAFKTNLHVHKSIHTGVYPLQCKYCIFSTNKHTHLAKHLTLHSSESPYVCELCGHTSLVLSEHKHHSTLHFDYKDKRYWCMSCTMTFRQLNHIQAHIQSKHEDVLSNMKILYKK